MHYLFTTYANIYMCRQLNYKLSLLARLKCMPLKCVHVTVWTNKNGITHGLYIYIVIVITTNVAAAVVIVVVVVVNILSLSNIFVLLKFLLHIKISCFCNICDTQ